MEQLLVLMSFVVSGLLVANMFTIFTAVKKTLNVGKTMSAALEDSHVTVDEMKEIKASIGSAVDAWKSVATSVGAAVTKKEG